MKSNAANNRSHPLVPILICFLLMVSSAFAARRPELKFLKTTDLPGLGLRMRLMPDATTEPIPPPTAYTYQFTQGARKWKVDMYDPHELWRQEQCAGTWADRYGNRLTIFTVKTPPPGVFPRKHVAREEYQEAVSGNRMKPGDWDAAKIQEWVAYLARRSTTPNTSRLKHSLRMRNLISVERKGNQLTYAFRLNRSAAGQRSAIANWVVASFSLNPAIELEQADSVIRTRFLDTLTCCSTTARSSDNGPSKVFQNPKSSSRVHHSKEFQTSRDRAAASIRNMEDWWFAETPHYIILSNLRTRHRSMIKNLQIDIELLRAGFGHLVAPRHPIKDVGVIRVFSTEKEYLNYVGPAYAWSGGLWMANKKELVIRPADWAGSRDQKDRVLRAVYHEGFHQYIFYAMDKVGTPPWFNEGHAALFEGAEIRNRKLLLKEDPKKVEVLQKLIGSGILPLPSLLAMGYEQFYASVPGLSGTDGDQVREANYAVAWGLIYYLRKGTLAERDSPYTGILDRFCDELWKGKNPGMATVATFKDVDITALSRDVSQFWMSRNKRSAARRKKLFDGAALQPRR